MFNLDGALVASIISFALVVITALLRNRLGESEAAKKLAAMEAALAKAEVIATAAAAAVVEVEETIKQTGSLTNKELKDAAVDITVGLLEGYGIRVDPDLVGYLFAVVEKAYQEIKI